MTPLARVVALPVRAYRLLLSPWVGHACRFQPTCSAYALEALEREEYPRAADVYQGVLSRWAEVGSREAMN